MAAAGLVMDGRGQGQGTGLSTQEKISMKWIVITAGLRLEECDGQRLSQTHLGVLIRREY